LIVRPELPLPCDPAPVLPCGAGVAAAGALRVTVRAGSERVPVPPPLLLLGAARATGWISGHCTDSLRMMVRYKPIPGSVAACAAPRASKYRCKAEADPDPQAPSIPPV